MEATHSIQFTQEAGVWEAASFQKLYIHYTCYCLGVDGTTIQVNKTISTYRDETNACRSNLDKYLRYPPKTQNNQTTQVNRERYSNHVHKVNEVFL